MDNKNMDFLGQVLLTEPSNKKLQEDVFGELRSVQDLPDYLRDVLSEDIKRYFNAQSPAEQLVIRGAYFRTMFMLNMIMKANEATVKVKKPVKLKVGRYAE